MLIIDIILYMLLALYFDAVVPGEYGQRKVPYFCFLPSFWKGVLGWSSSVQEQNSFADFEGCDDIELVPEELSEKKAIRYFLLTELSYFTMKQVMC